MVARGCSSVFLSQRGPSCDVGAAFVVSGIIDLVTGSRYEIIKHPGRAGVFLGPTDYWRGRASRTVKARPSIS